MRAIWRQDGSENWSFWLRWWDGVVSGAQIDWALQEKVALIPNEVWEQGPGGVAEAIREIEDELKRNLESEVSAKTEALLRAALADYSFDALHHVMRMVPFEDDVRFLKDPEKLRAFLDDAELMRDDLELYQKALGGEGIMQGASVVRNYLGSILSELDRANDANRLRVGRIIEHGKILEEYARSEEVAREFGPAIIPLRSHVASLLDLTRRHFASTLTRMAPLRDLSSSPDDDQWTLLQDIQRGIGAMSEPGPAGLVPLARDDQSALLSLSEGIERLLRQHDIVPTPQAKSSFRREIDHGLALLSVSVALYLDKARQFEAGAGKTIDSTLKQYKRATGLVGLWELVKAAWRAMTH
jgi:hypothetical protein